MWESVLYNCKVSSQISSQMIRKIIWTYESVLKESVMQQQIHIQLKNIWKRLNQFHFLHLILRNSCNIKCSLNLDQFFLKSIIKNFNIWFKFRIQLLMLIQIMLLQQIRFKIWKIVILVIVQAQFFVEIVKHLSQTSIIWSDVLSYVLKIDCKYWWKMIEFVFAAFLHCSIKFCSEALTIAEIDKNMIQCFKIMKNKCAWFTAFLSWVEIDEKYLSILSSCISKSQFDWHEIFIYDELQMKQFQTENQLLCQKQHCFQAEFVTDIIKKCFEAWLIRISNHNIIFINCIWSVQKRDFNTAHKII